MGNIRYYFTNTIPFLRTYRGKKIPPTVKTIIAVLYRKINMEKEKTKQIKELIKSIAGLTWEIIKLIWAVIIVIMMLKSSFLAIATLF